jgi:hypothetical protein
MSPASRFAARYLGKIVEFVPEFISVGSGPDHPHIAYWRDNVSVISLTGALCRLSRVPTGRKSFQKFIDFGFWNARNLGKYSALIQSVRGLGGQRRPLLLGSSGNGFFDGYTVMVNFRLHPLCWHRGGWIAVGLLHEVHVCVISSVFTHRFHPRSKALRSCLHPVCV